MGTVSWEGTLEMENVRLWWPGTSKRGQKRRKQAGL